ncbi:unnamed protein product [Clonostachys byssicola]|uniref:Uncharacterized protein n=1 Tax=Clonostachys byssicola TaxID=160290 RepID=A0A9N9XTP8_9HYPO|nr:unnamed protein product [Clonostachys byssicola]
MNETVESYDGEIKGGNPEDFATESFVLDNHDLILEMFEPKDNTFEKGDSRQALSLPSDQNQMLIWAITDANRRIAELEARHKNDIGQLKTEFMDEIARLKKDHAVEIAELKRNTVNKTAARPGGIKANELATIKSDISKLKSETAEITTVKGEIAEFKDKLPDLSLYCLESDLTQFEDELILKLRERFAGVDERLGKVDKVLLAKESTTENLKKLAASTVQAAIKEASFTEHIKKVAESKVQAMVKEARATKSTAENKRKREASVDSRRPKLTPGAQN